MTFKIVHIVVTYVLKPSYAKYANHHDRTSYNLKSGLFSKTVSKKSKTKTQFNSTKFDKRDLWCHK